MKLTIQVGASRDASFDQVFKSIGDAAKAAQRRMTADEKTAANDSKKTLEQKLEAQKAIAKAMQASNLARLKGEVDAERQAARDKSRENITAAQRTAAEVKRIQERLATDAAHKAAQRQLGIGAGGGFGIFGGGGGGGGNRRDMAYRMGYWASRNFSPVTPMLSMAGRMGSDLLRGSGINMDFGGLLQNSIELQKNSVNLSNQGYQAGKAGTGDPRGTRVGAGTLQKEFQSVGKEFGFDPNEVAAASTKFVDLTGDLNMARTAMGGLARLSNATNTNLTDMASAAATVSVQLERSMGNDMQGRAKALQGIMRVFAGQGKEGAVEIKDFAAQMAKVATVTNRFAGDRGEIFSMVGVLAQESRKAGGSASASQAATSVSRFAQYVGSKQGAKAFGAVGVNVFTDDTKRFLRNPKEIILEALSHTGGNQVSMGQLFKNVMAGRAVQGFTDVYNTARGKGGNNQAGLNAVVKEFEDLEKASITEKEEMENNAEVMKTTAKKAQVFQDQLQELVGSIATKVMPEVEKLGPMVLKIVDSFAGVVAWLAENPAQIITLALGTAIAKAGVEQTIRVGIENVMKGAMGSLPNQGVGGGVGVLGNAAAVATIAALSVTAFYAGKLFIDEMFSSAQKDQKEGVELTLQAENALAKGKAGGGKAAVTDQEEVLKRLKAEYAKENKKDASDFWVGSDELKAHNAKLLELQAYQVRLLSAIVNGGVAVKNFDAAHPSVVDPKARTNWVEVDH